MGSSVKGAASQPACAPYLSVDSLPLSASLLLAIKRVWALLRGRVTILYYSTMDGVQSQQGKRLHPTLPVAHPSNVNNPAHPLYVRRLVALHPGELPKPVRPSPSMHMYNQ